MKSGLARQSPSRKMHSAPALARMPRLRISPPRKPRCSWRTCLSGTPRRARQVATTWAVSGPEPSSAMTISKLQSDCAASAKHRLQRILAVEGRDDNRDESCVVQGPMLAGDGETVRIRLILHRLFLRMRALDDRRGRVAGHQTNQNDVATGLFDDLAANHFVAGVVGALDEHRRPHAPD